MPGRRTIACRGRRNALRLAFLAAAIVALLSARATAATAPTFSIQLDRQQAVFQLTNLAPGALGQRCLIVSVANGTADGAVLSATVGGDGLADYLDLAVDVGTAGDPATCAGFVGTSAFAGTLATLGAQHADPAAGLRLPFADGGSAVVRFSLTLRSDDGAQGRMATMVLRFDAQEAPTPPTTTPASTTSASVVVSGDGSTRDTRPRPPQTRATSTVTTDPARPDVTYATPSGRVVVTDPSAPTEPPSAADRAIEVVATTVTVAAKTGSVPAVFLVGVFGFLAVQDRLDRNDPKLARAPLAPEPELVFQPRREVSA